MKKEARGGWRGYWFNIKILLQKSGSKLSDTWSLKVFFVSIFHVRITTLCRHTLWLLFFYKKKVCYLLQNEMKKRIELMGDGFVL